MRPLLLCLLAWIAPPPNASAQACTLPCPTGYRCEANTCLPVCAPGCASCAEPGTCDQSVPARVATIAPAFYPRPIPAGAKPAPRDRQADGGLTLSFGVEGAYTFVYYDALLRDYGYESYGQSFQATGHMGSVMGTFEIEGGFSDAVYLGMRFAAGRIVNSDDSSGVASRYVIGPTLMLRPARPFYIGIDAMLEVLSFDDIAPNLHNYPGRVDPQGGELDGEVLAGLSFGLRFGFVIDIGDLVAITPEFRFSSTPINLAREDATVFFYDGGSSQTGDAQQAISASAGFMLATRLFF